MTTRSVADIANSVERFLRNNDDKANAIVRDDLEAHALAKELRRRGWKARLDRGIDISTDRVIDYVQVRGRRSGWVGVSETEREPQVLRMVTMLGPSVDRALAALPDSEEPSFPGSKGVLEPGELP